MRSERSPEQRHREAGRILGQLRRDISDNDTGKILVLVEGRRDRQRLNELGFTTEVIYVLNQGYPIIERLDMIASANPDLERLEVFMDWDRTGGRLQRRCMKYLSSSDIPASESVRDAIVRFLTPETRMVEHIGFWDALTDGMAMEDPPALDYFQEE